MNGSITPLKHPVGDPRLWSRDMALLGGLIALQAPLISPLLFSAPLGLPYVLTAGIMGALTGAGLGWGVGVTLDGPGRRWPLLLMLLAGPLIGVVWGGAVGAVSALALPSDSDLFSIGGFLFSTIIAGIAGALVFGWFWFPYVWLRVKRLATWPLVLCAALMGLPVGLCSVLIMATAWFLLTPMPMDDLII